MPEARLSSDLVTTVRVRAADKAEARKVVHTDAANPFRDARICNGLGIMRACLETQKLEQLESRMDEIADRVTHERTGAARERTSTHEAQRISH
jgi:hypothetical protein